VPLEQRDKMSKQEDNLRSLTSTFATRRQLSEAATAATTTTPESLMQIPSATTSDAHSPPSGHVFPFMFPFASHPMSESIVDYAIPKTIKTENRELLSRSPQTEISFPQQQRPFTTFSPPSTSAYNPLGRPYL
jgi:hypothetical protein